MELANVMERIQLGASNLRQWRCLDVNGVSSADANLNLRGAAFVHANNGPSLN